MKFDFAKNQTVKTLDEVPSDFRGLYVEHEGSFKLDTEDAKVKSAVAAITGLNSALVSSRAEVDSLKGKQVDLSSLADYGTSPEEIKTAIATKIEELQQQLAGNEDAKINLEKIKEDLAKGHAIELDKANTRNKALLGQLNRKNSSF